VRPLDSPWNDATTIHRTGESTSTIAIAMVGRVKRQTRPHREQVYVDNARHVNRPRRLTLRRQAGQRVITSSIRYPASTWIHVRMMMP
jgi:hypothetical protein